MSPKQNTPKVLKNQTQWVGGITASPFHGLSITTSPRFLLLLIGQMFLVLPAFAFTQLLKAVTVLLHLLRRCFLWAACIMSSSWYITAPPSHFGFAASLSRRTTNIPLSACQKARTSLRLLGISITLPAQERTCIANYPNPVACPQGRIPKHLPTYLPLPWQYSSIFFPGLSPAQQQMPAARSSVKH